MQITIKAIIRKRQFLSRFRHTSARALVCMILAVGISPFTAAHSGEPTQEYKLKAAFLFNFVKYIDWPDDHTKDHPNLVIFAILGENPFGKSVTGLDGKTVKGKTVVVKLAQSVEDLMPCDIVFIPASESERMPGVMKLLNSLPVLTVSEVEGFTDMGGLINFVISDKQTVRFEINAGQAEENGIKISSRLLRLSVQPR